MRVRIEAFLSCRPSSHLKYIFEVGFGRKNREIYIYVQNRDKIKALQETRTRGNNMKIHVLIEDTPIEGYKTEHGLSLFIEHNGENYLLDAGTTDTFLANAEKMQIPVGDVKCSVLSHGHYDHSGGYATYLSRYPKVKVYAMESAKEEYYSGSGGVIHEVGVPKNVLPAFEENFIFIENEEKISDSVYLIPHSTEGLAKFGERAAIYKREADKYVPDAFSHEVSLVLDTEKGLVIFNSCSHGGLHAIISEVKQALPGKNIYAFVGGLHMKGKLNGEEICIFSESEMQSISEYLKEIGLKKLYTGHCTGTVAFNKLKSYLGDMVEKLNTGDVIEL